MGPPRSRVLWVLARAAPRGPSLALPALQLWEISSGELLLSVLFDVGIMAVTMDLAEHHMFCGGSDGSIFQVDLCTWVSDGRPRPPQLPVHHEATPLTRPRPSQGPALHMAPCPSCGSWSHSPGRASGASSRSRRLGRFSEGTGGLFPTGIVCMPGRVSFPHPLSGTPTLCVPHRNQVTCLSVSTDSTLLLSGSHDETVRLWDIRSKQCVRTVALKGGQGAGTRQGREQAWGRPRDRDRQGGHGAGQRVGTGHGVGWGPAHKADLCTHQPPRPCDQRSHHAGTRGHAQL